MRLLYKQAITREMKIIKNWKEIVSIATNLFLWKTKCFKVLITEISVLQIAWKCIKCKCKYFFINLKKTCPACGNEFFKTNGFYETGLWFCSIGCCPNRDEIEEMFLDWTVKDKQNRWRLNPNFRSLIKYFFLSNIK